MMTVGYFILGGYCPGIQHYLPQGNATVADKEEFWKNRLYQLVAITTVAVAILICIESKLPEGRIDDPAIKEIFKDYGINVLSMTAVIVKALQSDNEQTRQAANLLITSATVVYFVFACALKMVGAIRHLHRIHITPIVFTPEA